MWEQIDNPRRFRTNQENDFTTSDGGLRITLHHHGLSWWILKEYRGKFFVLKGSKRSIRNEWNEIVKRYQ